ncbi:MAG: transcriptional repressor [Deltaproteobacteria bacterium]|nr:transcriptional repressor [Deltaproteobacteria bacterium]
MNVKKTRNTRQRTLILEILRTGNAHLTAEEVLQKARRKLPTVSLGTVYRNLHYLRQQGYAREVRNGDNGSARFEAAGAVHAHFHCRSCNKVRNVRLPEELVEAQWSDAGPIASVSVLDLHLIGDCSDCSPVR